MPRFIGTIANDVLVSPAHTTEYYFMDGMAGDDRLTLEGIYSSPSTGRMFGGDGDDFIDSGYYNDAYIHGGNGDDHIEAIGNDRVYGGAGNDYILAGNFVSGGAGDDTIISGAETVFGNSGHDFIYGINCDFIDAGSGNDTVNFIMRGAYTGGAQIYLGNGNDIFYIELESSDFNYSDDFNNFAVHGGNGNDRYDLSHAVAPIIELENGGIDTVYIAQESYFSFPSSFTLADHVENLEIGPIWWNYAGYVFDVIGNTSNNLISGSDVADRIHALAGNDTLLGRGGDDQIFGEEGNDDIDGGIGNDSLDGGEGNDILRGNAGNDTLSGGIGDDVLRGEENSDTLHGGDGLDRLFGGAGQDTLNGDAGNDVLRGEAQNDVLNGGAGTDQLFGDDGNDTLNGGDDNDRITGGLGRDFMTGGLGADRFAFDDGDSGTTVPTADVITDFSIAQGDRLDLSAIDAWEGGPDNAFTFIGNAAFTATHEQLRYYQAGGNTYVEGDVNGDGVGDFLIRIDGIHNLGAPNFIL